MCYHIRRSNGRRFCGRESWDPYEIFLQLEGIQHRRTKVRWPQKSGFIERLHQTLLDQHFRVTSHEMFYESVSEMPKELEAYLMLYKRRRTH